MPALPLPLWIACAALLGLVVGSFLNVVIRRLPPRLEAQWRHEARAELGLPAETNPLPPGIVYEPSHCPACQQQLAIRDNIPLLSWLLLHGRCRNCHAPISRQYPLVELLAGVLSILIALRFPPGMQALAALMLGWSLLALASIDARTQLLPDQLTLPLLWLGLIISLGSVLVPPTQAILGAVLGYLSLWSVYWIFRLCSGKEGMGYGDFKLFAALGAWLGSGALLPMILIASLLGLGYGLCMLVRDRQRERPVPFGPFLALAGMAWLLGGKSLSHWCCIWSTSG